jgi:hypothetical protein
MRRRARGLRLGAGKLAIGRNENGQAFVYNR